MRVKNIKTKVNGEESMENTNVEINFAKVSEGAIIPSKESENGGYDIYACFEGNFAVIQPHDTVKIPTGIASSFSEDYVFVLQERGSTGTKGIAQRCGVIDSGYRGEWLCPVTNTSDKLLVIAKEPTMIQDGTYIYINEDSEGNKSFNAFSENDSIVYPYEKAICQALLLPVPKTTVKEITYAELQEIPSNRGDGRLGSTGK